MFLLFDLVFGPALHLNKKKHAKRHPKIDANKSSFVPKGFQNDVKMEKEARIFLNCFSLVVLQESLFTIVNQNL